MTRSMMRVSATFIALASSACVSSNGPAAPAEGRDASVLEFVDSGPDPLDDEDAAIGARALALFGSARCSGGPEQHCHGDGAGGMWLRFGDGGDVIGVPSTERPELWRVRPFDPERSYLMLKVAGDAGIDGDVMPVGNGPDPRIASLVHAWIEAGAPTR